MNTTERMLAKCGDFGRYQYLLMGMFCIINLLSAMHYYSQTIISFVPEHWCYNDKLINCTYDEIRKIYENYTDPHCTPLNDPKYLATAHQNEAIFYAFKNGVKTIDDPLENTCEKWIYNLDYGYESMTSELNWVCQYAWQSTMGQSLFFIGSVVGTMLFGIIADKIGRLPVLILSNMMAMVGNALTIFALNVPSFAICRFIAGMATDSNNTLMYILVMEYIRPSKRTFGLNLSIGIFYCIGSIITPWIAVGLGTWRQFLLAAALPTLIVPTFYFFVPESALWLISKNRIDDAIMCFQRVAKFNGKELDTEDIAQFRHKILFATNNNNNNNDAPMKKANLFGLFKTPRLRRNILILFFKSMVITLAYDAISRNVEGLGISPFIMFSLSATAIFPACVLLLLLQDKIGRKGMASSSLLVSGIFTAASGIVIAYQRNVQSPVLLATLAIIGRFGVTVAYNSGAQYATELIPTCIRGQGVAAVHVAGYALTFFSSYILYLSIYFKAIPSLILGALSLIGAILVLFLPETLNRVIPTTLEDGERFGEGERFFHFSCFENKRNHSDSTTCLRPET